MASTALHQQPTPERFFKRQIDKYHATRGAAVVRGDARSARLCR
jgi:hypothetical protein